ncbi:beta-glucosidase [Paenibacillus taihuensis]|uniref:beta-glucosidase n=1 Tax=Paenibacillus taihuensis TaxID=1156355 RepID=A0A3D9SD14_9BACL|nr:glycoside hydrolase family 3 N-terminal domain-containing protein [Paenibacillus taihuensis]REE92769.1 beta-glucosidase [Paenibacillus taihuensis]
MSDSVKTNASADIQYVTNGNGPTLGFSAASGVRIIEEDGLKFKDLSKDGKLHPYVDWRLPAEQRAKDLAARMSIEQIAGLMLYSPHQAVPGTFGFTPATYDGKPYAESGADAAELTDQQHAFLTEGHLRHILVTAVSSPADSARWNNNLQAVAEASALGIPVNISTDPRHSADASTEYNAGSGGTISMWPEALGLAATFDPAVAGSFGEVAAKEYRALGIATALSPQVDIATDPRWSRFNGTFGEDPWLSADMAKGYIDGFQTTEGDKAEDGWGTDSVNAMVKHWPGGGSGEGGRDAHFGYGKYAVYPGDNFKDHLIPFTHGAFNLKGGTGKASAVMPYYTISKHDGQEVANSYSDYLITDLLRGKYGYEGVVCTDWGITDDEPNPIERLFPGGRSWGMETGFTVAERHYRIIMAGVDQFGGNSEIAPILEAYRIGASEHGESYMRARFEQSAVRLLSNLFRVGLFENPYLQPEESERIVGSPEFVTAGYEAQVKSLVMLKNKSNVLPLPKQKKVYIPQRHTPAGISWFGFPFPEKTEYPINLDIAGKFFEVTHDPSEADFAIVAIRGADSGSGYDPEDKKAGGTGYVPISLQYNAYTAEYARAESLAGDSRETDTLNRSYKGKTVTAHNAGDLQLVLDTRAAMGDKPVIVTLSLTKPTVCREFEPLADAIVVNFGVSDQALLDVLTGAAEPSGLLPMQLPANMRTVEEQLEDVPHDMEVHVDSEGNGYDFAFGLNWSGIIADERTERYKRVHG